MMASNLISRLLPSNPTGRSIYEELQAHDETYDSDIEERAGLALDEENLRFRDEELGDEEAFNGEDSRITTASTAFIPGDRPRSQGKGLGGKEPIGLDGSKWLPESPRLLEEDGDDGVPESLLIEDNEMPGPRTPTQRVRQTKQQKRQSPIPGPSDRGNRAHWEAAQAQQQLYQENRNGAGGNIPQDGPRARLVTGSPRDKAMYRWNNVTNIDNFVLDVYDYYRGSGFSCIVLDSTLNILLLVFLATFTVFLTQCVDYPKIRHSKKLSEVMIPKCTTKISGVANLLIWLFTLLIISRIYSLLVNDIPRLIRMRDFYTHLLGIPENDMQTVTWQDVVVRIMAMRDSNPMTVEKISSRNRKFIGKQSKERLDAHDIANRLMRRENYFIAMFNKEILDLTVQLPFVGTRQFFSKHLQWNLSMCIMDYLFNNDGQVWQLVLKDSKRRELSDGLRRRFIIAGFINAIFAPITVVVNIVFFFLRYFNEYKRNPSAIGSRQYTPLAEWKFREFNELEHLFIDRINMSYPFASRYLDQFPKVKTVHFARFVAFVAGSIVAVLTVASLWDPELFFAFEISPDMSVALYITILGGLWAVMSGTVPEPNGVFDPEYALRNVIDYTHYSPPHWKNRLHSDEVKREFSELYQMKIMQFLQEIFCILVTPFILWFSLPKCSDQIIDFFREFTIHVDGVGYVCSFAVFDFKNGDGRNASQGKAGTDPRDDYYNTKQGKMAASYYGFIDNYVLNPKTGIQGHIPPGNRTHFNPPPSFPGLMSPTLAADMQNSRMGRSERRPSERRPNGPGSLVQAGRTPRFAPAAVQGSPLTSILLDPHHHPSSSGFGARSTHRNSRSRYLARQDIVEDPTEDDDDVRKRSSPLKGTPRDPYESAIGLGESRWETSPTRGLGTDDADEDGGGPTGAAGGVLGLLYQFQKAQTDGRPAVSI